MWTFGGTKFPISEDEYNAWSERYQEATAAMDDREAKVDALSDELEQDLRLLGATAIEDRLQDGVPEAIADLKRAGIKIWVATGDKLETAIGMYPFFDLSSAQPHTHRFRRSHWPQHQSHRTRFEYHCYPRRE
jgi:phospholipid-translocating ATPase